MKNYLWIGWVCFCLLLGGCTKKPVDSQIEGMWQLEEFVTRQDGVSHPCDRLYYSITRYVVEVAEKQGSHDYGSFVARFAYGEGREELHMQHFKRRRYTSDSGEDATVDQLLPFGMNATSTTFRVKEINRKRMVLESDYATLWLSKF